MRWCVVFLGLALQTSRTLAKSHSINLERNTTFIWLLDYKTATVGIEVHVKNKSSAEWFAVGFSDYGELQPSDLCVFWVDWKGKEYLQDTWVDKEGIVSIDPDQDCENFRHVWKNDTLVFFFTRRFDTCDKRDYVIEDGTTHIVWARGRGPLYSLDGVDIKSADTSGFQRTTLLANDQPRPEHPKDTWNLDIKAPAVQVPNEETTYWCTVFRLPDKMQKKHHIIQYDPLFEASGVHLVHHMEIFHCAADASEDIPMYEGSCLSPKRPNKTRVCSRVLAAWAMGAPPFPYPEEAGLPIGGPQYNPYVMLEIHYNNPELTDGVVDSSGFRLHVTPTLRKYDAGVMELGLEYNDKMAIPPGQERFRLSGYCVNACTAVGIPSTGITIFGSQLHTHLTGTRVYTKHVREGVELPEINRDNHYSQHFQEIRRLKTPVKVLPGDALITTCEYNTVNRIYVTLTGFSIAEEMCVNYVHYFPRTDLEVCKSSIPNGYLEHYFHTLAKWEKQNTSVPQGISAKYKAIEWNPMRVFRLERLYHTTPISMQCNQSSGARFPGGWEGLPSTKIYLPQLSRRRNC